MKLFVCNLPWSATEADFVKFLDGLGYLVTEVKVAYDEDQRRSRGYAFVTFASEDMYQQALRDLGSEEFWGRELRVAPAREKSRNGGSRGRRARRDGGGEERDCLDSSGRYPECGPESDFTWEDVS